MKGWPGTSTKPLRLTARFIEKAQAEPGRPWSTFWHDDPRGLGLRVTNSGVRSFLLRYRTVAGRQREMTLGAWCVLTLATACDRAKDILRDVAKGGDPAADRVALRRAETVNELLDRYVSDHVEKRNKATTARRVKQLVEKRLKPEFGTTKLPELDRQAIVRWHASLRATPIDANRALAALRKALSLAVEWKLLAANPALRIKPHGERQGTRVFSDEELQLAARELATSEARWRDNPKQSGAEPPVVLEAIRLIMLSGLPGIEVRQLRWSEVDIERRRIVLADAKIGQRFIPMPQAAIRRLASVRPKGVSADAHVFLDDYGAPLDEHALHRAWARVRKRAGISSGGLHTFRRTSATAGAKAGLNAFVLRDLYGWKSLAMASRYVQQAAAADAADIPASAAVAALDDARALHENDTTCEG